MANVNDGRISPSTRDSGALRYDEPIGLRQRKRYSEVHPNHHVYSNWRHDVLRLCLPDGYDEERRLSDDAITRGDSHVVFTAAEDPNAFLDSSPVTVPPIEPAVEPVATSQTTQAQLSFSISPPDGPVGSTPNDLTDESVFEDSEETMESADGRGTGFWSSVNEFAEDYARGEAVELSNDDERRVTEFLDRLEAERYVEEPAVLLLEVDGERGTISELVDLVHVTSYSVESVDDKPGRSRRSEAEGRTQLSVYYKVLPAASRDRERSASIYYTEAGDRVTVQPLSPDEVRPLVSEWRIE